MRAPSETHVPNVPSPVVLTSATPFDLERSNDATRRWTHHFDTFNDLLARAPGVYQALRSVLHNQLSTDPDITGLRFHASATFINLIALATFTRHHPQAPAELNAQAQVVGVDVQHPILRLSATQLLDKLAALDLPAIVSRQWHDYWAARAKGTAVSRLSHARHHYQEYERASRDATLARRDGDEQALGPGNDDHAPAGFDTLFENLLQARLQALEHNPGDDLQTHAELALAIVHRVDARQYSPSVLSTPPALEHEEDEPPPGRSLFDFGSLDIDMPYAVRRQQINLQYQLLTALSDDKLQAFKREHAALEGVCADAERAIDLYLQTSPLPPVASEVLLKAHYEGLHAHARIQHLLGQINDEHLRWVEGLVGAPESFPPAGSAVIAAHPQLHLKGINTVLRNCVVITLRDPQPSSGLLLYWPGESGGLLHCTNLDELARCFDITDSSDQSLNLVTLSGNVLAQILAYHLERGTPEALPVEATNDAWERAAETLAHAWTVPRHAARDFAFKQLQEQAHSEALSAVFPSWLVNLQAPDRLALKTSTLDYIAAMRRAQALIARDLPNRLLFCRQHISEYLKRDFPTYDGKPIGLDLPQNTAWKKDFIAGSGAPGVPVKPVLVASTERETVRLETLLLEHIDDEVKDRLHFMALRLQTADKALEQTLRDRIDKDYLVSMASKLDLAQQYEEKIRAAYAGIDESPFARELRREVLGDPLRLMLKMHCAMATAKGDLDDKAQVILNIAIDADNAAAYRHEGHDIRLIPAMLTAGGADTNLHGTVLSGVTFISDLHSGLTLLYRPEHPTRPVRQYPSLEAARIDLYRLAKQTGEIEYLAERALQGNPDAHRARLREAIRLKFDGIIGLGTAWPATTSLAQHLLDAQLGRMLEAHRATSRSNDQLWLENFAYQSGMVFNHIKMALGFLPVIGTVIGIYDFFEASANAATALINGQIGRALDELEYALLAFIDAALDLLPGAMANPTAACQLTRQRQLHKLHAGPASGFRPGAASARQRLARFDGYEYQVPLSLDGIEPGTQGKYRGIYQHPDGDFILVEDRPCQVQWLETEHTWRLRGTPLKTWRKNIAMDENGQWDTHFALYGVHLMGGGAGGGQVIGHLAERLDPYWPAAIRDQLPRFLVDSAHRRRRMLESQSLVDERTFQASLQRTNTQYETFDNATPEAQMAAMPQMKQRFRADIDAARTSYSAWDERLKAEIHGLKHTCTTQKSRVARALCNRLIGLMDLTTTQAQHHLYNQLAISLQLEDLTDLVDRAPLLQIMRIHALHVIDCKAQLLDLKKKLDHWLLLTSPPPQPSLRRDAAVFKSKLTALKKNLVDEDATWQNTDPDPDQFLEKAAEIQSRFEEGLLTLGEAFPPAKQYLREVKDFELLKLAGQRRERYLNQIYFVFHNTRHLIVAAQNYTNTSVLAEFYINRLSTIEDDVHQMHSTLLGLQEVPTNAAQRREIHSQARQVFRQYKLDLQSTYASLPELFDAPYLKRLYEHLDLLIDQADKSIQRLPGQRRAKQGTHTLKLFQVENGNLYIGDYFPAGGTTGEQIVVHNAEGGAVSTFEPSGKRWRKQAARPTIRPHELRDLKQTASQLLADLENFRNRTRGYMGPNTVPADLEDIMNLKAVELESCAERLELLGGSLADTADLRTQATQLRQQGTQLRIDQIKLSHRPNEGQLMYLHERQQIGIQAVGERQRLKDRDFLQEYEVRDLTAPSRPVMWYAHFHYRGLDTPFENFSAAHLKRLEDRYLRTDEVWRGSIRHDTAKTYFASR
ncbi:hypothetical protein D3C77_50690 [compost metagenome]